MPLSVCMGRNETRLVPLSVQGAKSVAFAYQQALQTGAVMEFKWLQTDFSVPRSLLTRPIFHT